MESNTQVQPITPSLVLGKYSFGMGDRFAHQAHAQLRACQAAHQSGISVTPVWNKSNREHTFTGSQPASTRDAAAAAVRDLGWTESWHVDADHIGLKTVDRYLEACDFYTLDVAEAIGGSISPADVDAFLKRHPEFFKSTDISGMDRPLPADPEGVRKAAFKYLPAVAEAGRIYRHIATARGSAGFIAEVSMDETDEPQSPGALRIILAALADEYVPIQTIAPKFTGRFNKGVDYVGDLSQFEREFSEDLAVIAHSIQQYGLPANLKLSVHSGSDKFSLYPIIQRTLPKFDAGLHIKTAGTTWLEEVIGLAEAGGGGLTIAKDIYREAFEQREALCAPYSTVIDIHPNRLPSAQTVMGWSSEQFVSALRHDPTHPEFNPDLRQLLHVAFKIAAKLGARYLDALGEHKEIVGRNVTFNLLERHMIKVIPPTRLN